eukprot:SAG31_NODE_30_length_32545_cov_9.378999_36_plen_102_part_00
MYAPRNPGLIEKVLVTLQGLPVLALLQALVGCLAIVALWLTVLTDPGILLPLPKPGASSWPPAKSIDVQMMSLNDATVRVVSFFLVFVPTIREIRDFHREM